MKTRLFTVVALFAFALPASAAPPAPSPRDEALRLAPNDFALVVVVQNLREHVTAVGASPFAAWFPTTALGKQLLNGADFKRITDAATPIFGALGITPSDLLHDIIGDAVVFAYNPAPANDPKGERSLILVRPAKQDTLVKVIDRLNDGQTKSKELKAVVEHKHAGVAYSERQKADGGSDFYCFRGGVFAITASEAEIKAVIDRSNANPAPDKPPVLADRMAKLGISDAAVVLMVHPRAMDADLAAKVKNAKPEDKNFLTKFQEVWTATDALAIYLALDTGVEAGVSLRFDPAKLPANIKGWLVGERTPSAIWSAVPDSALFAVAGRVKPNDLLDFLASITPPGDKNVRESIEEALGPIVGKDKLPLVLDALGPDWGLWVVPPAKDAKDATPVAVAAIKVQTDGPKGAEAAKALVQSLDWGFQAARIAYNAGHKDQLELKEEKDGDAVIKSLSGAAFPAGVRPCFALKGGYLVLSTSPEAIKAFKAPTGELKAGGDVPLARFNATAARNYLTSNANPLAKLLASAGAGDEKTLAEQLAGFAAVLEPAEKVELLARGDAGGVKLMLRVKPAKPLKK